MVGYLLSNHAVWYSIYNGQFYQSYATHPYAGLGIIISFIGVITLIAGMVSTIVYDLKISKYSHKIEVAMGQPLPPKSEQRMR